MSTKKTVATGAEPEALPEQFPEPEVVEPAAAEPVRYRVRAFSSAGFWRGGRHWTSEAQEVSESELSPQQLEAVLREPLLKVERLEA